MAAGGKGLLKRLEGLDPVFFLKRPAKVVVLSKPTEKQAVETVAPFCKRTLAFSRRTLVRCWFGVIPYNFLNRRVK